MKLFTCPECFHRIHCNTEYAAHEPLAGKCCPVCAHTITTDEVEKAERAAARWILAKTFASY